MFERSKYFFSEGELHGIQEGKDGTQEPNIDDEIKSNEDEIDGSGESDATKQSGQSDESIAALPDEGQKQSIRSGSEEEQSIDFLEKNTEKRIAKLKQKEEDLAFENYNLKMQLEKNKPQAQVPQNSNIPKSQSELEYESKLAQLKVNERFSKISPSLEKASKKYPDFESSIQTFSKKVENMMLPEDVHDAISNLENAGEVLYHFSKNPSDFLRIVSKNDSFSRQRELLKMDMYMENKNKNSVQAPKTVNTKQIASKTIVKNNDDSKLTVKELRDKFRGKK